MVPDSLEHLPVGRHMNAPMSLTMHTVMGVMQTSELYDHKIDPDENVNIAGKPQNKALVNHLMKELGQVLQ